MTIGNGLFNCLVFLHFIQTLFFHRQITASLLLFMEEEDVFWMMCTIIEDLLPASYYSSTLIGVQVCISTCITWIKYLLSFVSSKSLLDALLISVIPIKISFFCKWSKLYGWLGKNNDGPPSYIIQLNFCSCSVSHESELRSVQNISNNLT